MRRKISKEKTWFSSRNWLSIFLLLFSFVLMGVLFYGFLPSINNAWLSPRHIESRVIEIDSNVSFSLKCVSSGRFFVEMNNYPCKVRYFFYNSSMYKSYSIGIREILDDKTIEINFPITDYPSSETNFSIYFEKSGFYTLELEIISPQLKNETQAEMTVLERPIEIISLPVVSISESESYQGNGIIVFIAIIALMFGIPSGMKAIYDFIKVS